MINRKIFILIAYCTFLLLAIGCGNKKRTIAIQNQVEQTTFRFEEFLAQNEINETAIEQFEQDYTNFSQAFNEAILRKGTTSYTEALRQFQSYFDSIQVNQYIQEEFPNFSPYENQLRQAQSRLQAVFPEYNSVDIVTMNSGFNYKNFLLQNSIAIGLDMYLGGRIEYATIGSQFPQYKIHSFSNEYLVPDAVETILRDVYPDNPENNSLLSKLIYEGKIRWLKSLVLPNLKDHQLFNFTEDELNWCKNNEQDIWRYFVSEELLYSRDYNRFKTYVNEGPFSSGMPQGSPANTGTYIGYQILKTYDKQHPNQEIKEILQVDAQSILNRSGYKP